MDPNLMVILWAVFLVTYWPLYFMARKRVWHHRRHCNYYMSVSLTTIFSISFLFYYALRQFGLINPLTIISIVLMSLGGVGHHISLFLKHNTGYGKMVDKVHGPISHYLFFTFFMVNTLLMGISLLGLVEDRYQLLLVVCLSVSLLSSLVGLMAKVRRIVYFTILKAF